MCGASAAEPAADLRARGERTQRSRRRHGEEAANFKITMEIYTQVTDVQTRDALKRLGESLG
jgi:hypothetical protein